MSDIPSFTRPPVLVLMGVTGTGKSTVAGVLAGRLDWDLCDGDDLHPPENVRKMAVGQPLTDEDRWPWLRRVADWIQLRIRAGRPGIITCSALKRSYRDLLRDEHVVFVHLAGTRDQIAARLVTRGGHFMPTSLLDSQFAALEPPGPDEQSLKVELGTDPRAQAAQIVDELGLAQPQGSRP